jgi:hypothetical protein
MVQDEFSTFWSDDGKRSSTIIRFEGIFKVVFEDTIAKTNMFKYYQSLNSAEDAAENFVMYESY